MPMFLDYLPDSMHRTWIPPLQLGFSERMPPRILDRLSIAEPEHLAFFKHQLREVEAGPDLLFMLLAEDGKDVVRVRLVVDFCRMWGSRLSVWGQQPLAHEVWGSVLPYIESIAGYFAIGSVPPNGEEMLGREIVNVLEGGWYGRYEVQRGSLVPISRAAFDTTIAGLGRTGPKR